MKIIKRIQISIFKYLILVIYHRYLDIINFKSLTLNYHSYYIIIHIVKRNGRHLDESPLLDFCIFTWFLYFTNQLLNILSPCIVLSIVCLLYLHTTALTDCESGLTLFSCKRIKIPVPWQDKGQDKSFSFCQFYFFLNYKKISTFPLLFFWNISVPLWSFI